MLPKTATGLRPEALRFLRDEVHLLEEQGKTLSAKTRNKLPDSAFAIPEKRAYPIHDPAHAAAALSLVAQYGTPEEKSRVRSAVKRRYPKHGG